MKNKKRVLALLLALAMIATMAGCSQDVPPSGGNSQADTPAITQDEANALQAENERLEEELETLKETQNSQEDGKVPEVESLPPTEIPLAQSSSIPVSASTTAASAPPVVSSTPVVPAASTPVTSTPTAPPPAASSGKSGALVGYNVTVNDVTTIAVRAGATNWPIDKYYFYSASGAVLGYMQGGDIDPIQRKYMVGIDAPANGGDWSAWFADQFNLYRGIGATGSGAVTAPPPVVDTVDIAAFRQEVIRLTNLEREKVGVSSLELDNIVMDYAQIRAKELAISFSHTRPSEASNGPEGLEFGENIAMGQRTPEQVVAAWMNSSGHKATMLGDYSDYGNKFGVGFYQDAEGICYWVQEFVLWDAAA